MRELTMSVEDGDFGENGRLRHAYRVDFSRTLYWHHRPEFVV
jgi:hypothetical protein